MDEIVPKELPPDRVVETLALRKAKAVAQKYREGLVIGSDTIVAVDGIILGKPKDDEDALSMILKLQGRVHQVYSGVAVIEAASGKLICGHEVTDVCFRPISKEEALRYIESGEPKGKAGSYGIQGLAAVFVMGIKGDYFNVVGLPLFKLAGILKSFGVYLV